MSQMSSEVIVKKESLFYILIYSDFIFILNLQCVPIAVCFKIRKEIFFDNKVAKKRQSRILNRYSIKSHRTPHGLLETFLNSS
jgi:hypothetical protein